MGKTTYFGGGGSIHNVFKKFLLYFLITLFNNDPQQISFNSAKNGLENGRLKHDF